VSSIAIVLADPFTCHLPIEYFVLRNTVHKMLIILSSFKVLFLLSFRVADLLLEYVQIVVRFMFNLQLFCVPSLFLRQFLSIVVVIINLQLNTWCSLESGVFLFSSIWSSLA